MINSCAAPTKSILRISESFDEVEVDTQGPIVEEDYRKILEEFPEPLIEKTVMYLKCLDLHARAEVHFKQEEIFGEEVYFDMAKNLVKVG